MKQLLINTKPWMTPLALALLILIFSSAKPKSNYKTIFNEGEGCTSFQAIIETEKKEEQQTYYKVTISCKLNQENKAQKSKFLFKDQYRFTLYMLEDIFEVISEAEQKCSCDLLDDMKK